MKTTEGTSTVSNVFASAFTCTFRYINHILGTGQRVLRLGVTVILVTVIGILGVDIWAAKSLLISMALHGERDPVNDQMHDGHEIVYAARFA